MKTTHQIQLTENIPFVSNSLTKIQNLIGELNSNNLRYCHWKSNIALGESLAGQTDIDLLVHRKDTDLFRTILSQLNFRPAFSKMGVSFPSVEHYYALDEGSGKLVHLHAYYQVITGQSLTKNYHLPIEDMLLENTRQEFSVRLPTKNAELVVFTLRMMLKHTSVVELLLLARYWKQVKKEVNWLLDSTQIDDTLRLVGEWLPSLDLNQFAACINSLSSPASLNRRIALGLQLRSQLRPYARHSVVRVWWSGIIKFSKMFYQRFSDSPRGMMPGAGGVIIAFVGPEATGKSTLINEIKHWLGEHFAVEQIHAGKPKPTIVSFVPNLLVPALRSIFPEQRSTRIESRYAYQEGQENSRPVFPLFFAVRSTLLAYDRRTLLTKAFSRAANGNIILCDRYPSSSPGATDSPQLSQISLPRDRFPLRRWFARLESQLYKEISPPDLVISLSVPLEVAIKRNKTRGKEESEDLLRLRHAQASDLEFDKSPVIRINTDQPLEETLLEVKKAIWNTI